MFSVFLNLLDRIALWWIERRRDEAVERSGVAEKFSLRKAEIVNGMFEGTFVIPAAAILAENLAGMLDAAQAENYVQFDILPRLDRQMRPIRVTVQWANGESPARQNARLRRELAELQR